MKRIVLRVEEPGGVDRPAWPVTQGTPFADGDLVNGAPVRVVTAQGEVLPTQALCLATWHKDGRYVKWLLVDFQIDLAASQAREVYLEYGPGVTSEAPDRPVTVTRAGEGIDVDTGVLKVEFRPEASDFLPTIRVRTPDGWRALTATSPGPHLHMADQQGGSYASLWAPTAPDIVVEDSGPVRASVCVRGHHASDDGQPLCPYVLRLHFYAGKADVRVFHTFVFDQNPELVELSEIGFRVPLNLGDDVRIAFGGEEGTHQVAQDTGGLFLQTTDQRSRVDRDGSPIAFGGDEGPQLVATATGGLFLQTTDQHYRVEQDGIRTGAGRRSPGWGSLCGPRGSVVAVVRDMWKEYPKGMRIGPGGIDVQVWPGRYGEALKFSTPWKAPAIYFRGTRDETEFRRLVEERPSAPLNLKSTNAVTRDELLWVEEMVAKYAPARPASYNDTGVHNGFGAAKTTEFLLRFSADQIPDESAESLARCVQEPVIASPEVPGACATGAVRLMAPCDPVRFPDVEAALDCLFEKVVAEPRQVLRTYGMIDYGDLMCSHSASPAAMWGYFRDEPDIADRMKHCSRAYNNEANDQLLALWENYIHTGMRKYCLVAEAYGEHMADVDITHAAQEGTAQGLIHYHSCHHWTGEGSPSHTAIAGLMLQYYLTGNRRLLDVCREVGGRILAHQEPCGIYGNREGVLVREYTTPLACLLELYQATWDERYGELARRSLRWLLLSTPEPGSLPFSIYTAGDRGDEAEVEQDGWHLRQAGGMTPQLLYDAVRVFGESDPIFRESLLGMAHRYVWAPGPPLVEGEAILVGPDRIRMQDPGFNAPIIAYAFELTGDPAYAAYCRHYLRDHFPGRAREMSFTAVCWGSIIPPMIEAVRRAEATCGGDALDRVEEEWVREITCSAAKQCGPPPSLSRPPRRSLGVIKGYDS